MKLYSREEARHMLCRYHNLDGAEALCGKIGIEKIMQRIHSIQYDPLNVVARFEAEPVLQAGEFVIKNWWWEPEIKPNGDTVEIIIEEMTRFAEFLQIDNSPNNIIKLGV